MLKGSSVIAMDRESILRVLVENRRMNSLTYNRALFRSSYFLTSDINTFSFCNFRTSVRSNHLQFKEDSCMSEHFTILYKEKSYIIALEVVFYLRIINGSNKTILRHRV